MLFAGSAAVALAQNKTPAPQPAEADVAVALVLAVDTSGSVSMGRFELQKQGYAAAFRNPQVLNAIRSLATRSIRRHHDAVDRAVSACRGRRLVADQG
ncbi:MAG TPA: DUF1194 domain-containing protein [Xanthobacteraceae bacterium]|nr:DUF1194 domain-containing protein [Xanthobacteraceae bacterium]